MERHETPDPVRSDAMNVRFHGVRPRADLPALTAGADGLLTILLGIFKLVPWMRLTM
jgi:hypothetical protein